MEQTQTCPICKTKQLCECKNTIAQYLNLLLTVDQRVASVSTSKPTSIRRSIEAQIGIDKLNLELPINGNELKNKLSNLGMLNKLKRLNTMWAYDLGSSIFLPQQSLHQENAILICNPNNAESYLAFEALIQKIVSLDLLNEVKIKRLDLNLDYSISFKNFIKCLEVNGKQTDAEYITHSGTQTGLRIGKGTEKINIYDKTEESYLDYPVTRLEIQLSGEKLPTKKYSELKQVLILKDTSEKIFSRLILSDIVFTKSDLLTSTQKQKITDFKFSLEKDGLFKAKQYFNKENNFERDFKNLIQRNLWIQQPKEIFNSSIDDYFNKSQSKGEKWPQTIKSEQTKTTLH